MLNIYLSKGIPTPSREYNITADTVSDIDSTLREKGAAISVADISAAATKSNVNTSGIITYSYRVALILETSTHQVALIGAIKEAPDLGTSATVVDLPPELEVTFTDINTRRKRAKNKFTNTRLVTPGEFGQDKKVDTATIAAVDILRQDSMYQPGDIITDCNITHATPISTENLSVASWLHGIISSRIKHQENMLLTPSTGYSSDVGQLVSLKVNNRMSLPSTDLLTNILDHIGDGLTGLIPVTVPMSQITSIDRVEVIMTNGKDDPNGIVNLGSGIKQMDAEWFLAGNGNVEQSMYADIALRVADTLEHMCGWFNIASISGLISNVDKSADSITLYDCVVRFASAPGSGQRLNSLAGSVPNYIKTHLPYIAGELDVSIWFNKRGTGTDVSVTILSLSPTAYSFSFDMSVPGAMGVTTTAQTSNLVYDQTHAIMNSVDNLYSTDNRY